MTKRRRGRIRKGLGIFLRKYPWQVHFQFETLTFSDVKSIAKFLVSGKPLGDGQYIRLYEEKFRDILDRGGYAYSFGAGRMALYAIFEALGIGEGDEVVVPAFTCEVVVNSMLYRKIKPVYADIEQTTFNIDVSRLEKTITPATKAIIAQHTFGIPCDMDGVNGIAKKYNLYVIEDCALSMGSRYKGRPVGTLGDAAIFSTDRTKIFSTLIGGLAFTTDRDIAEKIGAVYKKTRHLSNSQIRNIGIQLILGYFLMSPFTYFWGQAVFLLFWKLGVFFWPLDDKESFNLPAGYPYPCRLSNLQAMLGIRELERIGGNLKLRRDMVKEYVSILKANGVPLNYSEEDIEQISLRFSILLKDRDSFIRKWLKYFDAGRWFDSPAPGWYDELERICYTKSSCPSAEFVHEHIINFPTHQRHDIIRKFLNKIVSTIGPEDVVVIDE